MIYKQYDIVVFSRVSGTIGIGIVTRDVLESTASWLVLELVFMEKSSAHTNIIYDDDILLNSWEYVPRYSNSYIGIHRMRTEKLEI